MLLAFVIWMGDKMKKKIITYLNVLLCLFLINAKNANAEININAAGGEPQLSTACKGGVCSSTVGIAANISHEPVDGIRVILMNNMTELGSADLWFTEDKMNFAGGSKHISDIFEKYKDYDVNNDGVKDDLFDFTGLLEAIKDNNDYNSVEVLLQHIGPEFNISNTYDYYLVIEPIFVLRYNYASTRYYFSGTVKQVFNGLMTLNSSSPLHNLWAKYFAYKDSDLCTQLTYGTYNTSTGKCKNWNVLRNYTDTIRLDSVYGPFTETTLTKDNPVYEKVETYDKNIWGKGILKISDVAPSYTLTINKTDMDTGQGIYGVEFVVNGKKYSTNINGICAIPGLEKDKTYTITEVVKNGYLEDQVKCSGCDSINGTTFTVHMSDNKTINITNRRKCTEAVGNSTDPIERIKLYGIYGARNLLDFNNTEDPCGNPDCSNNIKTGCLSASGEISNFSKDNLSCFKETIDLGNQIIGYCGLDFKLYNVFQPTIVGKHSFVTQQGTSITAGQMFLNLNKADIATGTITKTCYVYGNDVSNLIYRDDEKGYNSYISDLKFNNLKLKESPSKEYDDQWKKTYEDGSNLVVFQQIYKSNYLLPMAYSHKISGRVIYTEPSDKENYKELGYGFASSFNSSIIENIDVPFSIYVVDGVINNKNSGELTAPKNTCEYSINKEIVKNDKLDIEFRIIDVNNPFPGKDGLNREVGKNWCDEDNCFVMDNKVIQDNIQNRIDSSYRCQAKYTIELTPNDIKAIREYNKNTTYDDYNLTCTGSEENKVCQNSFLDMLRKGVLEYDENSVSLSKRMVQFETPITKDKITEPSCQYTGVTYNPESSAIIISKNSITHTCENGSLIKFNKIEYSDGITKYEFEGNTFEALDDLYKKICD